MADLLFRESSTIPTPRAANPYGLIMVSRHASADTPVQHGFHMAVSSSTLRSTPRLSSWQVTRGRHSSSNIKHTSGKQKTNSTGKNQKWSRAGFDIDRASLLAQLLQGRLQSLREALQKRVDFLTSVF